MPSSLQAVGKATRAAPCQMRLQLLWKQLTWGISNLTHFDLASCDTVIGLDRKVNKFLLKPEKKNMKRW